jgi:hypothetical protein
MLGRLPSKIDPRTLRLASYLTPELPPPPTAIHWETKVSDWGVMGNERYGNCVIVTAAHMILSFRANELDDTRRFSDQAVIELSQDMGALNGYNILERLKYWRTRGMWSDKITAFASVDPKEPKLMRSAIHLFGSADIGLNMPAAWRDEKVWSVGIGRKYRPNTWGGHSVPLVGYDDQHVYAVTWGAIQPITWPALFAYCDEAYAVIDPNWTALDGVAPSGVDLTGLQRDLQALTQ